MSPRMVAPMVRDQWSGSGFVLDVAYPELTEHRCAQCYHAGFGKSNIRCRNEPVVTMDGENDE